MSRAILIVDLEKTIQKITKEYGDQAKLVLEEAAEDVAKKTVQKLKDTSPKRTGKYSKGWRIKRELTKAGAPKMIIHNYRHGALTHLLEYGHATVNGGRTRAFPHIKPAEKEAIQMFEDELRKKL